MSWEVGLLLIVAGLYAAHKYEQLTDRVSDLEREVRDLEELTESRFSSANYRIHGIQEDLHEAGIGPPTLGAILESALGSRPEGEGSAEPADSWPTEDDPDSSSSTEKPITPAVQGSKLYARLAFALAALAIGYFIIQDSFRPDPPELPGIASAKKTDRLVPEHPAGAPNKLIFPPWDSK